MHPFRDGAPFLLLIDTYNVWALTTLFPYMYTYNCHFCLCFRSYLFVLAPLSEMSEGVGTIRTLGLRCPRFGCDPCSVSRVASPLAFLALGMFKANPWVSASPIPVYASPIPVMFRTYGFYASPKNMGKSCARTRLFALSRTQP